jgi:hypothetical protein
LGGGIYSLSINSGNGKHEKLVDGSYRQAEFSEGKLYAVDYVKCELHIFDSKYNLLLQKPLNLRHYTGLSLSDEHIFLISSADDVIQVYDRKDFTLLESVPFSSMSRSSEGMHHLNDCHYADGKLFFSYFSKSGIWRNEVFDGGISYLDLKTSEIIEVLSGLFQPHSPTLINNSLHYCESPRGHVYSASWNKLAELPGFVRSIAYANSFYFVGLSETLYMKRATNIKNVMMNCGIFIIDEKSGLCKFIQTEGIKSIHTVLISNF